MARWLALALLAGCASGSACPMLPATHLVENFCATTAGYCFAEDDAPF